MFLLNLYLSKCLYFGCKFEFNEMYPIVCEMSLSLELNDILRY